MIGAALRWGSAALKTAAGWPHGCCRFEPSCSVYAGRVLQSQPLHRAVGLIVWRLLRCGPWSAGGRDPAPAAKAGPEGRRAPGGLFL